MWQKQFDLFLKEIKVETMEDSVIKDLIVSMASKNNLDAKLIWAICMQESAMNPKVMRYEEHWQYQTAVALSSKSLGISYQTEFHLQSFSYGLMQLMGSISREFGFTGYLTDLLEPETGLHWSCLKLAKLCGEFKDQENVIAAWNAGFPKKTISGKYFNQTYVDSVLKYYSQCLL